MTEGPETNLVEQESEYRPTFSKKSLTILTNTYGGFSVGIQNFHNHDVGTELCLAEIEDFPGAAGNSGIWENILLSLPEARIDFGKFKKAVQETIDTLFEGKAKVSFPDEAHIDCAIECMEEDSFEPAVEEGEDMLQAVGKIFGLNKFQLKDLVKSQSGK